MQRRYVSSMLAQNWSMHVKYASRQVLYSLPKFDSMVVALKSNVAARDVMDFCLVGCANNPDLVVVMVRVGFATRDFVVVGVVRVVVARDFMFGVVADLRIDTVARVAEFAAMLPRIVVPASRDATRSAACDIPIAVISDKNKNRKPFFLIQ